MTDMNSGSGPEFAREYVEHLITILRGLDYAAVGRVIDLFLEARTAGNTIFFLGNGGSAATVCHFANDFGFCASPEGHTPFRCLSLTANSAFITCLANDIGYDNIFSWQLRNLMRPGDVVVGNLSQRQLAERNQSSRIRRPKRRYTGGDRRFRRGKDERDRPACDPRGDRQRRIRARRGCPHGARPLDHEILVGHS